MGHKIYQTNFTHDEIVEFRRRLMEETHLLQQWFHENRLNHPVKEGGFELEFWLLDKDLRPACENLKFVEALNHDSIVTEVIDCSVEINAPHCTLENNALSHSKANLDKLWEKCKTQAKSHQQNIVTMGLLPVCMEGDHKEFDLTNEHRYHALRQRFSTLRNRPTINIDITGKDHLKMAVDSFLMVGLSSAFQIHMRVSQDSAVRYYNAALMVSAPLLAIACNSPFLLGKQLWEETRVPLYEQILDLKDGMHNDSLPRVMFGTGYLKNSFVELYLQNQASYMPLLPQLNDSPPEALWHLKLHNGNIYRWNRPVVDFDSHGLPHLRIEHRSLPSGPTITDDIANAALYYGLIEALANQAIPLEKTLPFHDAKQNFFNAAKHGLEAKFTWGNGVKTHAHKLLDEALLPLARQGLAALKLDKDDIDYYLGVIQGRLDKNRTGSSWQRDFITKNGQDFTALTSTYMENQQSGKPLHQWD